VYMVRRYSIRGGGLQKRQRTREEQDGGFVDGGASLSCSNAAQITQTALSVRTSEGSASRGLHNMRQFAYAQQISIRTPPSDS
jgi:hypothetical protein